ncbi:MAG: biotin/lipoyl-binding protein [Chthoniobacteraceae bacterium]
MRTFSESWHRVRDVRASLRPQVRVHRQRFRGERWFVLHDPFNNQFFRVSPAAYDFVVRLDGGRTVQQAWEESLGADPDGAPGQQDVIELLAQLYSANLLYADLPIDTVSLFDRFRKRRRREIVSKWLGAMFARFPLWDPDDFLRRVMPVANLIFNRLGFLLWLLAVGFGIKVAVDHFGALVAQGREVLDPSNLAALYVATVMIKLLHEFGHAILCRKFGGEVHTFGVMLMIFTPMPFVDATSAWSFRGRWQRVMVGAGGMIVELFIAAIAAFIWSSTGPGWVNSLAYNVMFSASVSTVLFNINPLLRFDGYYLLMDWFGLPNLYQRSTRYLRYLGERYLFGLRREKSPANNPRERWWLAGYGIAGGIYRVVLFAAITLFVANRFFVLGLVMAAFCVIAWVIVPLGRFIVYLASSPRLHRSRPRAVAVTLGGIAVIVLLLAAVPMPASVHAYGSVQADEYTLVATAAPGHVERVLVASGSTVKAGQPLLQLADPELNYEVRINRAQLLEANVRRRQAIAQSGANLRTIDGVLESLRKREAELVRRERDLVVIAAHDGLWASPRINDFAGRWLTRGSVVGEIVNPAKYVFTARVPTRDALELVSGKFRGAGVRLLGQPNRLIDTTAWHLVQAAAEASEPEKEQRREGAGESDAKAAKGAPEFEVRAELLPRDNSVRLLHGQTGIIRIAVPWEPLLSQWMRTVRQIFQNRPA